MTSTFRIPQIGPLWLIVVGVWLGLGISVGDFAAGLLFDPSLHLRAEEDWWNRLWNMGMLIATLLWGDAIAASPRRWWLRLACTVAWYGGGVWLASGVTTRTPVEVAIDVVGLLAVHRILIHLAPVPRYRWPTNGKRRGTENSLAAPNSDLPRPPTTKPPANHPLHAEAAGPDDHAAHRLGIIDLILLTTTIAVLLSLKRIVPTAFEPMQTYWAAEAAAWGLIAASCRAAHMAALSRTTTKALWWAFLSLLLLLAFSLGLPSIETRLSGNETSSWTDFAPNYAMWSGGFLVALATLGIATRVQSLARTPV